MDSLNGIAWEAKHEKKPRRSEEKMGNSLKECDRFTHKPLAEPWSPEGGKEG